MRPLAAPLTTVSDPWVQPSPGILQAASPSGDPDRGTENYGQADLVLTPASDILGSAALQNPGSSQRWSTADQAGCDKC